MASGPRGNVPKKHYAKWLQTESRLVELEIWIGFAKYVLAVGAIAGLIIFLGNRPPETLSYLLRAIGAVGSVGAVGGSIVAIIRKYRKRNRHDDN